MGEERYLSWKDLEEIGKGKPFPKYDRRATNSVIAPHLERRNPEGRTRPIIAKNIVVHKPDKSRVMGIVIGLLKVILIIVVTYIASCVISEIFGDLENFRDASVNKAVNVFNMIVSK